MGVLAMLLVDGAMAQEMDSHTTPMVAFHKGLYYSSVLRIWKQSYCEISIVWQVCISADNFLQCFDTVDWLI